MAAQQQQQQQHSTDANQFSQPVTRNYSQSKSIAKSNDDGIKSEKYSKYQDMFDVADDNVNANGTSGLTTVPSMGGSKPVERLLETQMSNSESQPIVYPDLNLPSNLSNDAADIHDVMMALHTGDSGARARSQPLSSLNNNRTKNAPSELELRLKNLVKAALSTKSHR